VSAKDDDLESSTEADSSRHTGTDFTLILNANFSLILLICLFKLLEMLLYVTTNYLTSSDAVCRFFFSFHYFSYFFLLLSSMRLYNGFSACCLLFRFSDLDFSAEALPLETACVSDKACKQHSYGSLFDEKLIHYALSLFVFGAEVFEEFIV